MKALEISLILTLLLGSVILFVTALIIQSSAVLLLAITLGFFGVLLCIE